MPSLTSIVVLAAGLSTLLPFSAIAALASSSSSSDDINLNNIRPRHVKGRNTHSSSSSSSSSHHHNDTPATRRSSKRRHHARLAAGRRDLRTPTPAKTNDSDDTSPSPLSKRALLSGNGFGTLYYDMNGGGTCGPVNGWYSFAETNGYAMCEPNAGYKTLAERGSNRVVAMPSEMLSGHLADYCGKEVKVTWNGRTVDNLVIWDGCAACNGANGLDFSSTVFAEIFGADNCDKGKIYDMSWEITGKQLWAYPSGDVVSGGGSDNSGGDQGEASPSSSSSRESPSTWTSDEEVTTSSVWSSTPSSAPTTKPWSSSSKWTSSSSSVKPQPQPQPSPTKSVANGSGAIDPHSNDGGIFTPSKKPPQLVVDTSSTATSSSEDSSLSGSPGVNDPTSESSTDDASGPEPTEDDASSEDTVTPTQAPSPSSGTADGQSCNDSPGAWVCSGNTMQQCIQTTGDWIWKTRVWCNVAPINCDSPNPVCPKIASGI